MVINFEASFSNLGFIITHRKGVRLPFRSRFLHVSRNVEQIEQVRKVVFEVVCKADFFLETGAAVTEADPRARESTPQPNSANRGVDVGLL